MGIITPSKFASRDFLKQLRQDNYISWTNDGSFKEYSKEEVDELYFKKCSDLANNDIEKLWKDHCKRFDIGSQQDSNNIVSNKGETMMQSVSNAQRIALKLAKSIDREIYGSINLESQFKSIAKSKRKSGKHRQANGTPVNFPLSV